MSPLDVFWAVVAVLGTVASIALLVYMAATGRRARDEEDAARAHFDRHGRWPDE